MATTIKNATLKVTVKEEITLNGNRQDSENVLRISDINEIYKRILTCPANNETTIASFHGEVYSDDGTLDKQQVKYIRVTNLDGAESLTLSLQVDLNEDDSAADESASILLEAGRSFVMGTPHDAINVDDTNANVLTDLMDLESILVQPGSNSIDVEVFVASA
tara:strand:- start:44 stop:532 length:489 start_codon:yes stop_codon:yes gene_type:complete